MIGKIVDLNHHIFYQILIYTLEIISYIQLLYVKI